MKFGAHTHVLLRTNCSNFVDPFFCSITLRSQFLSFLSSTPDTSKATDIPISLSCTVPKYTLAKLQAWL